MSKSTVAPPSGQNIEDPIPFEIAVPDTSIAIRGIRWPGDATPVVLVHDTRGDLDLDSWGRLPELLSQNAYTVLAMDLPGCGLSEGTSTTAVSQRAVQAVLKMAHENTAQTPALIVAGDALHLLDGLDLRRNPIRALVVLSPPLNSPNLGSVPKLAFVGAHDDTAMTAADTFLQTSRGWTLVSSFGTDRQGHSLLQTSHAAKIMEQMLAFLRDYRVVAPEDGAQAGAEEPRPEHAKSSPP